jgi:uncharacterized circularly permuted ATP-grasp superfamily protein/uncharacterized alpha-E superfamily protein
MLGAFAGLDDGGLIERARRLDRAFEEEGVTSVLPGAMVGEHIWRCDPIPLPIAAAEFAELEAGLIQRAVLLEAVLADIYGAQSLLAEGLLPPAVVCANPSFLRPCRVKGGSSPRASYMQFYAADLIRGPDGAWRVLADRTAGAGGIGYARENRRVLARVLPEAFRSVQVRQLRPFFDLWQDSLQRAAPAAPEHDSRNRAVALLTAGPGHAQWFEHMFLARELSCALVEGGDLTVRGGAVFLKTLKGLQPVDVLLRRLDGRMIDPLELASGSLLGVPGLMDAQRAGMVHISNDPGSGVLEATVFGAFLARIARHLLGEQLRLPGVPTVWLGEARARTLVERDLMQGPGDGWLIRPATDGTRPGILPSTLGAAARAGLGTKIAARPWEYAASAAIPPSVAPCAAEGGMEPRPITLRLFLVHDGTGWHAMEGGLARVAESAGQLAGGLPRQGLSKDVWVLSEDRGDIVGPPLASAPALVIRRTAGELPSRAADDLFWLGRYVERLETGARLIRATILRLTRGTSLPREIAELQILARCLARAELLPAEAQPASIIGSVLAEQLLASVRDGGVLASLFARIAHLIDVVRDRLTGEMYAAFTHALREARTEAGQARRSLDALSHAMIGTLRFAATVSGVAAESMVRGGGFLFLDLGRRIERVRSVAAQVAFALDQPNARLEAGLRLILELCDSVLTYRARYQTLLQPAPVLDLVIADTGNPRGLAFQLVAIGQLLGDAAGATSDPLPEAAAALLAEATGLVARVAAAADQEAEAALLPQRLLAIDGGVAALSDQLTRRFFALLPAVQAVGIETEELPALRGAA